MKKAAPEESTKKYGLDIHKGILVAVGGNEDKEKDLTILRKIASLVNNSNPAIEVITAASSTPIKLGDVYLRAFNKIGITNARVMHIKKREEANNPEYMARIKKADIIFFTGGDQLKITSILGGSDLLYEIRRRYFNETCVVAGTSAGATAMPDTMIYGGESAEALRKGAVHMTAGVGLVKHMVIDSHFITRGRFSRLMEVVACNPGFIGLGLGEDTGVIIRNGHIIEAIGNRLVVIFDGHGIKYTNVTSLKDGEAISVEGVLVHTLTKGHGYNIWTREYLNPKYQKKVLRSINDY